MCHLTVQAHRQIHWDTLCVHYDELVSIYHILFHSRFP